MTLPERILATVGAHLYGMPLECIADAVGATDRDVQTAVRLLVSEGHLYRRVDGKLAVTT